MYDIIYYLYMYIAQIKYGRYIFFFLTNAVFNKIYNLYNSILIFLIDKTIIRNTVHIQRFMYNNRTYLYLLNYYRLLDNFSENDLVLDNHQFLFQGLF